MRGEVIGKCDSCPSLFASWFLEFVWLILWIYIIKVNILVVVKRSYRSPPSCWLLSLEWSAYFEHVVQSRLTTCLFYVCFLDPHLSTYHSKFTCLCYCCVGVRHVYLISYHSPTTLLYILKLWNNEGFKVGKFQTIEAVDNHIMRLRW